MLVLDDIRLSIGDGQDRRRIFDGLSLTFADRCFHCLSGPSGSGKTTVLSLLAGIVLPDSGIVAHCGAHVSAMNVQARLAWRVKTIALAFQTNRLIDILTVSEHLALVARIRDDPAAQRRGENWIARFGLDNKLQHRPTQLSGGEKARVALAQALAAATPVLLADEPTAALDSHNATFVASTLREHAESSGATVIAVSHDKAMFDLAHKNITLGKA
jgi:putative ABC transport system ATP-binding protein